MINRPDTSCILFICSADINASLLVGFQIDKYNMMSTVLFVKLKQLDSFDLLYFFGEFNTNATYLTVYGRAFF